MAAAKFGLGRLYLGQPMVSIVKPSFAPQTAADHSTEANRPKDGPVMSPEESWEAAWKAHHPDQVPPAPFVSNFVFVDKSKERAEELARKYSKIMFRWIVRNYSLTSSYSHIKGYETYSSLTMTEDQVDALPPKPRWPTRYTAIQRQCSRSSTRCGGSASRRA